MHGSRKQSTEAICAVLFGWEDTLIRTSDAVVFAMRDASSLVVGQEFPVTDDEEAMLRDMTCNEVLEMLCPDLAMTDDILAAYDDAFLRWAALFVHAVEDAATVVAQVRDAGLATCVVTAETHARVKVAARLVGLSDVLDHVVDSGDGNLRPPRPELMFRALSELRVPATRTVYVSSVRSELVAAAAAGIRTVAVSQEDEMLTVADCRVPFLTHVPPLLRGSAEAMATHGGRR